MDQTVIKLYRRLLQTGFHYAGTMENPSIFLDTLGKNFPICDQVGRDYMNIYINIRNGMIEKIRYLCSCDPTANVVVETLCKLVEGKTLAKAEAVPVDSFYREIGSRSETVERKVNGIRDLLKAGLDRYIQDES